MTSRLSSEDDLEINPFYKALQVCLETYNLFTVAQLLLHNFIAYFRLSLLFERIKRGFYSIIAHSSSYIFYSQTKFRSLYQLAQDKRYLVCVPQTTVVPIGMEITQKYVGKFILKKCWDTVMYWC